MSMRRQIWRAHKWIGLCACIFMLIVSLTALGLNHPEWLTAERPSAIAATGLQRQNITALAADPFNPKHLVASDEHALYQSLDQGHAWQDLPLFVPAEHVNHIAFAPDQPGRLVVSLRDSGLYLSDDGGQIWEEMPLPFKPVAGEQIQTLSLAGKGQIHLKTRQGLYYFEPKAGWKNNVSTTPQARQQQETRSNWLYDLHTGKIFGPWGLYLYDAAALALIFLSLSGIYLSWRLMARRTLTAKNS